MSLNDAAVVYPNTAHFFLGNADTAVEPLLSAIEAYVADTTTPITGLTNLGHTTLDNVMAWGSDGGDSEVKGSLQNKSLREVLTSEKVDYFTVNSMQVKDNEVLTLYYGGGDTSSANRFGTPDNAVIQNRAVLVIIFDDEGPLGMYAQKCSVRADDSIQMPADDFTSLPLRFTPLKVSGKSRIVWIADALGAAGSVAPTVTEVAPATAGTAGGDLIVLTGTGFATATAVTVGGSAVDTDDWESTDDSHISMVAPAHASGEVDVTVTNPGGTSATGASTKLTYS